MPGNAWTYKSSRLPLPRQTRQTRQTRQPPARTLRKRRIPEYRVHPATTPTVNPPPGHSHVPRAKPTLRLKRHATCFRVPQKHFQHEDVKMDDGNKGNEDVGEHGGPFGLGWVR